MSILWIIHESYLSHWTMSHLCESLKIEWKEGLPDLVLRGSHLRVSVFCFLISFDFHFFVQRHLYWITQWNIEGSHIRPKTPQGIHGPTFVIPTWRWDSFFSGWSVSSIFWWFGLIWFRVGCFCLIWFVVRIRIHISILDSIICIILVVYNLGMLKIICWQNCWQKYNDAL